MIHFKNGILYFRIFTVGREAEIFRAVVALVLAVMEFSRIS